MTTTLPHLAHWGAFRVTVEDGELRSVQPHPDDPAPSPLHEPRLWPEYHAAYYGAYVRDPDGNNVEAVCHSGDG